MRRIAHRLKERTHPGRARLTITYARPLNIQCGREKKLRIPDLGLNRLSPIVQSYRMFCFSEKQPAFSDETDGRARYREARHDHPDHSAEQKRKQGQQGGHDEASEPGDTTKADPM